VQCLKKICETQANVSKQKEKYFAMKCCNKQIDLAIYIQLPSPLAYN